MTNSIAAYRAKVLAAHRPAFDLFTDVAHAFEPALTTPRAHPDVVDIVLDMFFIQAHKSYGAVALLAQHGLMEDSATITRRLMELSVQAVYVGAESDQRRQQRRAGCYLTFMWRQLPNRIKRRLPDPVRVQWTSIARRYARYLPKTAKNWAPRWRDMFREIGAEPAYEQDYSFLSAVAHGRPENQFFTFSRATVKLHSHEFASAVLAYASRYYLIAGAEWNRRFKLVPAGTLDALISRVANFRAHGAV